ncbi:UBP1-associated protein 2A-like [Actinidia eriantha]|uniref:UBP1-associated protein 2A-like n=1 Tax=Actinidia eriantha TaxID=165200 RepID=UPI00258F3210|nr:UBP1-associated protein 2A-like [Actinidia eriantha]XP_057484056.1 UBP1-associated protein 2A-like [Actinidia eriantha]XP_057484057.1 UBP1-associated protein 2A-like [Actinidia eriantha]XP_057484058.1 UBP1-associated protein 2A-like [Actinidia eriantha]
MGKKRKVLSSELDSSTIAPESEQPQDLAQIEAEDEAEPELDPIGEPEDQNETNEDEQESPEEDMDEDDAENGEQGEDSKEVNGDEEDFDEEPVEKLLEPFGKDQMVVLIQEAVSKYPDLMESVHKLADADPAHRKIFVHGLGWDANAETLTSEFGKYGEIEDCKAVCDKVSGKSKGYGFILFKRRIGAKKALKEPQKKIGSRMTSCQLASAGPVPAPPPTAPPVSEYTQRKIFVSNVAAEIDPQKLLEFFSKYGEVEDGPLGLDKQTGKFKGFCLFVYKSVESAKKALEEPHKSFEGHTLHCQKAVDGPKTGKPYFQHHQQHQHHQQQYHPHSSRKEKGKYSSGGGAGTGHLMAPSGPSMGFNPAVAAPALTPALGQALTALLASQGAGLGLGNLLGGLGAQMNQGVPPVMNNPGYGNQPGGSYGNQQVMQGGYQNPQMGQGAGRPQPGAGAYMGHGH